MVKTRMAVLALFVYGLSLWRCEQQPYREGARLYKVHCANCHLDDGKGLGTLIPPLAGSDYLSANRKALPCILKYGLRDTISVNGKTYAEQMPGVPSLSAIHITNILNFVNHSWGNKLEPYRLDEVQQMLNSCR